ncbi:MAG: winged helix-turn-helix domain-containing protein [Anaerolineaceae bacterium]|jgi:predicted transcriptional regulator|nr:winged helix-turn-helix domain-containing protein [Anaerolineaceae bacterium]
MGTIKREGVFIINDLETLKVVADPVRNQILEVLEKKPQNVKEVADKLGLAPSKLYYHFNMLEKVGLIKVVETRQVANLIEKYYHTTSSFIDIDHNLLNFSTVEGKENMFTMVTSTIDTTREDLLRSLQARSLQLEQGVAGKLRSVTLSRYISNMTDEKADEFHKRLEGLLEEFIDSDTKDPEQQTFAMTIAMYPSFYFRDLSKEE